MTQSLKEELGQDVIKPLLELVMMDEMYSHSVVTDENVDDWVNTYTDAIISKIERRIDNMIKVDNETIDRKLGTHEGKISAIASKNILILVKEMLHH